MCVCVVCVYVYSLHPQDRFEIKIWYQISSTIMNNTFKALVYSSTLPTRSEAELKDT